MSVRNLKLKPENAYHFVHVSLETLARWWGERRLYPTQWQRWKRWDPRKDTREWLTSILQNTPIVPLFVHESPHEAHTYHIIDGQNRSYTAWLFVVENSVSVLAKDVFDVAACPDKMMTLEDFSPAQQAAIRNIQIPMCVFPPETSEGQLRRVFRNLNKGKMLTSQEIIHSWTHVPIVNELLNPLDEAMLPRIRAIQSRWKPQHHRMMHTWVRIAAMMFNDLLCLGSDAERIEQWVARQESKTDFDRDGFAEVVELTVQTLEAWRSHKVIYSIVTIPDIAWVYHVFGRDPSVVQAMKHEVFLKLKGDRYFSDVWESRKNGLSHDRISERRAILSGLLAEMLEVDPPRELLRTFNQQPHGEPRPLRADELENAAGLEEEFEEPDSPTEAADLGVWQPTF